MSEAPTEAHIIRVTWEDQRTPGSLMKVLYAALTETVDEAVEAVKKARPNAKTVEPTGDRFSEETTKIFRMTPGQVKAL